MLTTKPRNAPVYSRQRRRRFSPLQLIGVSVTALIVLIAAGVLLVLPRITSHAAVALNMNCTLIVPPNPLTAAGLATPYQFVATDPAMGPCNESNIGQAAFVQATIFDKATSTLSAYEPLIVDKGTKPAAAPIVPVIPAGSVVGLGFGFNGTILHLAGDTAGGVCVNGLAGSDFGQFAYCNTPAIYQATNAAIAAKTLTVPALGTATDGKPCPTVRGFDVVDMDQSDNVQTLYLANGTQIAQLNAANKAALPNAITLGNPSDNKLVTSFLDPALGCTPWMIPNLTNSGVMTPTMVTDELQAAANQLAPVAQVPAGDEMVLVNAAASLTKINAYRVGVNQTPAATLNDANSTTYCTNLVNVGLPRLKLDMANFQNRTSPDAGAMTNSLYTFLANRMNATFGAGGLNCVGLLNIQNPITLTMTNNIVTAATITTTPLPATGTGTGTGTGAGAGGVQQVATGKATINLDPNAGNAQVALNLTYPNQPNHQINVNLSTVSCTATPFFSQPEDTDGNGMNNASTVINNLRGLQALPATWFMTVSDPALNNAVVACGSVIANATTGTVTLGTVTAAAPAANPAAAATAAAPAATAVAAVVANATVTPAPVGAVVAPRHHHKKNW